MVCLRSLSDFQIGHLKLTSQPLEMTEDRLGCTKSSINILNRLFCQSCLLDFSD